MSVSLKQGMTPEEVVEKLGVTHFSLGPVMNLGTRSVRYRATSIPGKVLDADFAVLKTGDRLTEWKITDEESYDDWMPIEAAKRDELTSQKD